MNTLTEFLSDKTNFWDELSAMNALQQNGVVSDNCVTAADVAEGDCERAVEWLKENPGD